MPADLAPDDQISQLNVLLQLSNLRTYAVVREAEQAGRLGLHGWWFDIGRADVLAWSPERGRFELIEGAADD